jgi:hypothetical protein
MKVEQFDFKFFFALAEPGHYKANLFSAGVSTLIIICGLVKPFAQEFAGVTLLYDGQKISSVAPLR